MYLSYLLKLLRIRKDWFVWVEFFCVNVIYFSVVLVFGLGYLNKRFLFLGMNNGVREYYIFG